MEREHLDPVHMTPAKYLLFHEVTNYASTQNSHNKIHKCREMETKNVIENTTRRFKNNINISLRLCAFLLGMKLKHTKTTTGSSMLRLKMSIMTNLQLRIFQYLSSAK